jgi:hypothetical protein
MRVSIGLRHKGSTKLGMKEFRKQCTVADQGHGLFSEMNLKILQICYVNPVLDFVFVFLDVGSLLCNVTTYTHEHVT